MVQWTYTDFVSSLLLCYFNQTWCVCRHWWVLPDNAKCSDLDLDIMTHASEQQQQQQQHFILIYFNIVILCLAHFLGHHYDMSNFTCVCWQLCDEFFPTNAKFGDLDIALQGTYVDFMYSLFSLTPLMICQSLCDWQFVCRPIVMLNWFQTSVNTHYFV